jgi:gliding motility-associated-like protein
VTATGYDGCEDTACVSVLVVIPDPALFIPSGFTPNNDGLNDTWHIIANDPCYTLEVVRVWNRWGMLVYDHDAWSGAEWNGTLSGQPQAMETYFYYIQAKCSERNKDEEYYGSLTLIR